MQDAPPILVPLSPPFIFPLPASHPVSLSHPSFSPYSTPHFLAFPPPASRPPSTLVGGWKCARRAHSQ
eukprot:425046-Hanusia_phi.AAC.2